MSFSVNNDYIYYALIIVALIVFIGAFVFFFINKKSSPIGVYYGKNSEKLVEITKVSRKRLKIEILKDNNKFIDKAYVYNLTNGDEYKFQNGDKHYIFKFDGKNTILEGNNSNNKKFKSYAVKLK
jgi:hypothetical protein